MPPINPTQAQLDARLNPTPVEIKTPSTQGLFKVQGDYGSTLWGTDANGKYYSFNLLDLGKQLRIAADPRKDQYGNYLALSSGAGGMADTALNYLKSKYGIDYNSISTYNDFNPQQIWQQDNTKIPNMTFGQNLDQFFSTIGNTGSSQGTSQMINTEKNALATPEQIAQQMKDPNWVGANTDPNRVINQTTGQTAAQMNAYNTILQSLQSGKPVTAEQYQAAGITDVVKFQSPSGYTSLVPKSMADQLSQQMPGSKVIDSAYTVVKGDTLSAIAKKNGMSLDQLLKLNPQFSTGGRNPNLIYPGDKVNLGTTSGATGGTGTTGGTATGGSLSGLVNNNTTNSNALASSASYSSVLGTLSSANSDRQKIQDAILALLKPSDRETELQKQLKDLQNRYLQAQVGTESQAIPLGLIGGQLDALKQDVAYRQMPLTSELEALQQNRESGLKSAQALYGFANDNEQQQMAMQKLQYEMSQPDTQVITETDKNGNVTAVVIDKRTGKVISQSNLGGIGKGFAPTSGTSALGGMSGGLGSLDTALQFAVSGLTKDQRNNAINTFNSFVQRGDTASAKQYVDRLLINQLPAGAKDDIGTLETLTPMIQKIQAYNDNGTLEGIGGLYRGSLENMVDKIFGNSSTEARDVRQLIGNIAGTIAKLRGGTSFTESEKALLETYSPTINENPAVALSKLGNLLNYIETKKDQVLYGGQGSVFNSTGQTQQNDPLGIL